MYKHEEKICLRCQKRFECKLGSINLCQCTTITLNDNERAYIRELFDDCLCASCLEVLKKESQQDNLNKKINHIFKP